MDGLRKENKFFLTDANLLDVENRLKSLMHVDEHQKGDSYLIRSIYYDSPNDVCMTENRAGISYREKYRIRAYNASSEHISAEVKIRYRDTISKWNLPLSKTEYEQLLQKENYHFLVAAMEAPSEKCRKAAKKYVEKIAGEHYRPKVIVEYERCAYVYEPCNVRITIDRNLTASKNMELFFEPDICGKKVLPPGTQVLEIKYDEFLPEEIRDLLNGLHLQRSSCSKYCLCRDSLKA